jgi:MYXO-CTERM domain-containing protein
MARAWASVVLVLGVACAADEGPDAWPRRSESAPGATPHVVAPLPAAHCEVMVEGAGLLDLETEYLPRVVRCENGGANLQALKAQAIAARSVAYYAMETRGSICDSQGCQVYGCEGDPEPIHHQAVQETSGQYLAYDGTLTYGFYVAGDSSVSAPGCMGADENAATEHYVTYNDGLVGTAVQQTTLGFVFEPGDNGFGQNRGCMGQWSARCLENELGHDADAILRFFYGADIEVVTAVGPCVQAPETDSGSAADESDTATTALDDTGSVGESSSFGDGTGGDGTGGDETLAGTTGEGIALDDATSGDGALPGTFGGEGGADGCACRATPAGPRGWLWLLLVGLLRARPARTRRRGSGP